MDIAAPSEPNKKRFHSSFLSSDDWEDTKKDVSPKKKKAKTEKTKTLKLKTETKIQDREKGDYYKPAQTPLVPPASNKKEEKAGSSEGPKRFHSSFLGDYGFYEKPEPVKPKEETKQKAAKKSKIKSVKPQAIKPIKTDSEEEEQLDRKVEEISKNVSRRISEEDGIIKKQQKIKIKQAKKQEGSKRYTPHKKRSIWQRIAHMKKYDWGLYDDLYDINPKDLPEEERKYYWEDVEELEDAQHDFEAFQAKKTAFLVGLASVGLALAICFGTAVYKDINKGDLFNRHNTTSEMPPNEIVTLVEGDTNLRLEENRAKGYLMKFEDQEYLRNRINENFIPENATEEQMRDIMQEAWRNLEPEVQKWVREPERVYEAQKRKEAEEAVQREEQRKIEERNNQTPKETEEESR